MSLTRRQVYLIAVNLETAKRELTTALRIAERAEDAVSTRLLRGIRDGVENARGSYQQRYENLRQEKDDLHTHEPDGPGP